MNTELIKTVWKDYADSRGFTFETREKNIALAGRKTEMIIKADDTLTIRGVFQLDITGWGQGAGTLNKTTVGIISNHDIELIDNKLNRKNLVTKNVLERMIA